MHPSINADDLVERHMAQKRPTKAGSVKVTPVLAPGFKAQVSRLAREAAAGVTVPIKTSVPVGAVATVAPPTKATDQLPGVFDTRTAEPLPIVIEAVQ